MKISIIAAVAQNGVIGNKGKIPWHITEDFRHFKELTMGHAIIMGQKTYLSIGKPLPGRTNIILTMDKDFKADGCICVYSPKEAVQKAKEIKEKEAFIIGGGQVYRTFLPLADKLYLTRIEKEFKGDTFFPEITEKEWRVSKREKGHSAEENLDYEFLTLVKK